MTDTALQGDSAEVGRDHHPQVSKRGMRMEGDTKHRLALLISRGGCGTICPFPPACPLEEKEVGFGPSVGYLQQLIPGNTLAIKSVERLFSGNQPAHVSTYDFLLD